MKPHGAGGLESVAVFLVGVAMVWLVFWIVRNDGAPSIQAQRGLYRMRVPDARPDVNAAPTPAPTSAPAAPPR